MSPSEFKAARIALRLTQGDLATILGVDGRTVRRWEAEDGSRPPNPIAARVLEWMKAGYRPPEWPEKLS
ncbi:hypothetical protein EU805_01870 [Salipiger sp. IMCC34102]|uniref:helix-turn-helix domain-containing protein n=1 Tax=Salipiger sp. IMCC34102 TaxID=2510647 RepID=UPI00101BD766|nr:helix-turn-helix domain-containing protein [Salipiger sp. IMCC34102]RYH04143.1 hypothetical protein EU805_01870 [Salipiger sp. IMCC34102]